MRRFTSSSAAMAVSLIALFAALGGTSWAAGLLIGRSEIKNGAVSSAKIGHGQVKHANLAHNSVTSANVADGSLTASDIAPNTFLPANGTAQNSDQLGGKPASAFVQGSGGEVANTFSLNTGQDRLLVDLGPGFIEANCLSGGKPELSYTAEVAPVNLIEWSTTFGGSSDVNTVNGLTVGNSYPEPNPSGLPQQVTWQAAANGGVGTAWTTGQDIGGTSCIFTGQALTTG